MCNFFLLDKSNVCMVVQLWCVKLKSHYLIIIEGNLWLLLNKIRIPVAPEDDTGGLADVPLYFSSISSVTLSALSDLSLSRRGSPLFTLPTTEKLKN